MPARVPLPRWMQAEHYKCHERREGRKCHRSAAFVVGQKIVCAECAAKLEKEAA